MQVVILAGGLGTRLRPLTDHLPKALVPVDGKPFLQHQLEWLAGAGVTQILLCVHHRADQIEAFAKDGRDFGLRITYAHEGERLLGTAGALKRAAASVADRFCVLNGDSYLPMNLQEPIREFTQRGCSAMMLAWHNQDRFDRSNAVVRDGWVIAYDRKSPGPDFEFIDYGLRIFRHEVLALLPEEACCDLDGLYERLIAQQRLAAYVVQEPFYEIGSPEGLARFERYVKASKGDRA